MQIELIPIENLIGPKNYKSELSDKEFQEVVEDVKKKGPGRLGIVEVYEDRQTVVNSVGWNIVRIAKKIGYYDIMTEIVEGKKSKKFETYLHICNGGVTFEVSNSNFGPTLTISSSQYGNNSIEQKIYTTKKKLKDLGEMFLAASKENYSPEYCNAAKDF